MWEILKNEYVLGGIVAGIGWLVNKVIGSRKDTLAGKAIAALATSSSLMMQYALTQSGKTPAEILSAFKGIAAIQLAKVGIGEKQRAPFQPLIDKAISEAVLVWVKAHPTPTALTMPLVKKLNLGS